jgi:signal transduction histidine kinase
MHTAKSSSALAQPSEWSDWRARAFRKIAWIFLALLALPTALAAVARIPLLAPLTLGLFAALTCVAILSQRSRFPLRLAVVMAAVVIVACLVVVATVGPISGAALGLACVVLLVGVFFGSRAAWWVSGGTTLAMLAIGAAASRGLLHLVARPWYLDWRRMDVWVRASAVYFATTSVVASTVAALLERLEASLRAERRAHAAADAARLREELLADASRTLGSSLDYEATLRVVAGQAIPLLGDYCAVDVIARDDSIRRIVVGSGDAPAKAALLHELERFTPEVSMRDGVPEVQLLRATVVSEHITDDGPDLGGAAPLSVRDPESSRLLRQIGLRSFVSVPLIARDRMLGALTFAKEHDETQDPGDVALVEEMGRRAAMAVDNGRLYEAAQRAIGQRDEFLTIAGHELRTPGTSLQLALQTLSRWAKTGTLEPGAPPVDRMLDVAERQAQNLNLLVDRLLDVSSIAGKSLTVVLSPVDLVDVVRAAVARLTQPLRNSGSTLTLHAGEPVVGNWDRSRMEQVALNLLSNAIKFGEGRPIEVAVEAEWDLARLVVRDHGIGIEPQAQGLIFGRFQRAVSMSHYGGLGLGLYVVQRSVERLGGTVQCVSSLKEGSTFTVTLPRAGPSPDVV